MDGGTAPGWWRREESPKLHGASFATPDLEADGPEERGPVGASLCPSHHRPVSPGSGEGARWFEGKERRALPLVPPTVVEDLTI